MDQIVYYAYQIFRLFLQKFLLVNYQDEDVNFVLFVADFSAILILLMYSWTFGEFDVLSNILVENLPRGLKKFAAATKFMLDFICDASAW